MSVLNVEAASAHSNTTRGWQVAMSLDERMLHMFDNEIDCDVRFVFPNRPATKISAHKLVLKAGSPVFEAMFSGNFAEANGEVVIKDICPNVFTIMLRYLYSDKVEVAPRKAMSLLAAAKKYFIDRLTEECISIVRVNLSESNVCTILSSSLQYDEQPLAELCIEYLGTHMETVIIRNAWYEHLSYAALHKLLSSDDLNVEDERTLFDAVVQWARNRVRHPESDAKIRAELGDCLRQIRFFTIKPAEFASRICRDSEVLTAEEKNAILCFNVTQSDVDKDNLTALGFNMRPRRSEPQQQYVKVALKNDDLAPYVGKRSEPYGFTFSVRADPASKALKFHGLSVYGSDPEGTRFSFTLKVFAVNDRRRYTCLLSLIRDLASPGGPSPIEVMFPETIEVRPDKRYAVMFESFSCDLYHCRVKSRFNFGSKEFYVDSCDYPHVSDSWRSGPIAELFLSED